MTFVKRSWFVINAFILILVLLTTRLIYWQMLGGVELLPLRFPAAGLETGGGISPGPLTAIRS